MTTTPKHVDVGAEGERYSLGQLTEMFHVDSTFWPAEVTAARVTKGTDGRVALAGSGGLAAYLATPASAAILAAANKYV
jgi:hypothetical protein